MKEGLFYVRRHDCADGSFEWYVLNGHTRRRTSKFFPTRAKAEAERRKLQLRLGLGTRQSARTAKFQPCLPMKAPRPPSGALSLQHDRFGGRRPKGRAHG